MQATDTNIKTSIWNSNYSFSLEGSICTYKHLIYKQR